MTCWTNAVGAKIPERTAIMNEIDSVLHPTRGGQDDRVGPVEPVGGQQRLDPGALGLLAEIDMRRDVGHPRCSARAWEARSGSPAAERLQWKRSRGVMLTYSCHIYIRSVGQRSATHHVRRGIPVGWFRRPTLRVAIRPIEEVAVESGSEGWIPEDGDHEHPLFDPAVHRHPLAGPLDQAWTGLRPGRPSARRTAGHRPRRRVPSARPTSSRTDPSRSTNRASRRPRAAASVSSRVR